MNINFVSDNKGRIIAAQLSIKIWRELKRKAEAFDVAGSTIKGLREVEQIESGEIKLKSFERLLNEL